MQPPLPCPTKTWHNDSYAAISPSRPELSARGKTVVVIGAGSGIGRETCVAFAAAGASKVAILGRNEGSLKETAAALAPGVASQVHAVDVTDETGLKDAARKIGQWDVLIVSAGFISTPSTVAQSATSDWWQSFETNVKGNLLAHQAFSPTANPSKAAFLSLVAGVEAMPAAHLPGLSAYISSKLAQTRLVEFIAAEHTNLFAATVHPGMVPTDIFRKSGATEDALPVDKAHFMVWLSSAEGAFLKGRCVWANWDVDELKAQADTIQAGPSMTSGVYGWPYVGS